MRKMRKGKIVRLRRVRIRQNLGNGFLRSVFSSDTVDANSFVTFNLTAAEGRVVVNAGWTISTPTAMAFASESFPTSTTNWRITIQNPTNTQRTVTPYLITKLAP
ncbi:hypothetical protein [Cohnella thailandensis]|uniref:Uncharacterized protein n=1 Tax=Cohnella thailandensis TaxID=557557 RepID=A0A841SWI9_9BACL|nr:hypothetical protein [Cohnella thailandensis]MBB6634538.1 hypothetical protein [Cohnella thailandensis]MBP1972908.1 hypothetical protein [Cohnella thailandensis]